MKNELSLNVKDKGWLFCHTTSEHDSCLQFTDEQHWHKILQDKYGRPTIEWNVMYTEVKVEGGEE
jgi:hypothetical protein